MDPITLGIVGGATLLKGGIDYFGRRALSKKQGRMADELEARFPRPDMPVLEYNIPEQLLQNRDLALSMYYDQMLPGQAYIENQVQGATAAGAGAVMRAGGNSADVLGAISGVFQNEQEQMMRIGVAGAENQMNDLNRLMGANDKLASAEQTAEQFRLQQLMNKWKFEEADPYMFAMQSAAKLRESQQMNMFNSLTSLGNTIGDLGYAAGAYAMNGGNFDFMRRSGGSQDPPMITQEQYGQFSPQQRQTLDDFLQFSF